MVFVCGRGHSLTANADSTSVFCAACNQWVGVPRARPPSHVPMAVQVAPPPSHVPMAVQVSPAIGVPMAVQLPPGKGLPVAAGVITMVLFTIYLLLGLGGIALSGKIGGDAMALPILFTVFAFAGVFEGARSCGGSWRSLLSIGILNMLYALPYFSAGSFVGKISFLSSLAEQLVMIGLLHVIAGALALIAIAPARQYQRYRQAAGR